MMVDTILTTLRTVDIFLIIISSLDTALCVEKEFFFLPISLCPDSVIAWLTALLLDVDIMSQIKVDINIEKDNFEPVRAGVSRVWYFEM